MADLRRPEKVWERRGRQLHLTRVYLQYLGDLIRVTIEEKAALQDLGVPIMDRNVERLEDLPGTVAFIEGDRA